MINREATIRWKDYDPAHLSYGSGKKVWCICEGCGKSRWLRYQDYTELCLQCSRNLYSGNIFACLIKKIISRDDYVICLECNPPQKFKQITVLHLKYKHGMSIEEYLRMHEGADIVSKALHEKLSSSAKINWENPDYRDYMTKTISDTIKQHWEDGRYSRSLTEDHKNKIGDGNKGKEVSEETKIKLRKSLKNRLSGDKHPNWQGGLSYGDYCEKFTQKLRTKIRDLYDNCDFISGLPDYVCNVLNGKVWKLDIHHVDGNKMQGCEDNKWLLIPLSRRNHTRTSGINKKFFWNRLFVYALEYDINYYNSEDGDFNVFKVI